MYLLVKPNGGKLWQMKYRFVGKKKTLSIGQYPQITLKEARDRRDDAKKLIANSQDPSEIKQIQKLELKKDYENNFEEVAREWHKQNAHTWKPEHGENILKRLEKNVFPIIGKRPIKNITPPELLKAVKGVEGKT